MPDVGDDREGGPLEGKPEGGSIGGDGDVECSRSLALFLKEKPSALGVTSMFTVVIYLCAPKSQLHNTASTVPDFLGKEPRVRVVLEQSCVRPLAFRI